MASEKIGALLILMFSIAYGAIATRLPLSFLAQQEVFTSRTLPYILAIIGGLLSIGILVLPTVDPEGKKKWLDITRGMDWKRAVALILSMTGYGLVMPWIGFILSSIFFLIIGFVILGETSKKKIIISAVFLVFVLWAVMSFLLGVYIAPGELFYLLGIIQ